MDKFQKLLDDLERKALKATKIVSKEGNLAVGDAVKVARKGNAMVSTMKKATKTVETFTPTHDESVKALAQLTRLVDLSEKQLEVLLEKKPQIEKLHVGGLVKKSMTRLYDASKELSDAMMKKVPEDLKGQSEDLMKRREIGYNKAMAAFGSSTGGEDQADGEDDSD